MQNTKRQAKTPYISSRKKALVFGDAKMRNGGYVSTRQSIQNLKPCLRGIVDERQQKKALVFGDAKMRNGGYVSTRQSIQNLKPCLRGIVCNKQQW